MVCPISDSMRALHVAHLADLEIETNQNHEPDFFFVLDNPIARETKGYVSSWCSTTAVSVNYTPLHTRRLGRHAGNSWGCGQTSHRYIYIATTGGIGNWEAQQSVVVKGVNFSYSGRQPSQ